MTAEHPETEFQAHLPPIPQESVEGWKEKRIKHLDQELVPLGPFTDFSDCDTQGVYFGERGGGTEMSFAAANNFVGKNINRKETLLVPFVRKAVYERLQEAQKLLPKGYYFKFYDGYRSLAVQQEMFETQKQVFAKQHPEWDQARLMSETHKAVAIPATDEESRKNFPAPHTTGAAIDLRLINLNQEGQDLLQQLERQKAEGALSYPVKPQHQQAFEEAQRWFDQKDFSEETKASWLTEYRYGMSKSLIFRSHSELVDMGSGFDHFGPEAKTSYYEKPETQLSAQDLKIRDNRRLFYSTLKQAGLCNYPEEWWHWSYGDQEWAANSGNPEALFGEADLDKQNKAMETARRLAYLKTIHNVKKGAGLIFF